MRWVEPIRQSFRSKAAMGMGMGGAITAVAATIMVGTAATTTVGGIIAIGGDFTSSPTSERPPQLGAFSFRECQPLAPHLGVKPTWRIYEYTPSFIIR